MSDKTWNNVQMAVWFFWSVAYLVLAFMTNSHGLMVLDYFCSYVCIHCFLRFREMYRGTNMDVIVP